MKRTRIFMAAAFIFAAGSAFVPKATSVKPTTPGQYWDTSLISCQAGTSMQTCATNNTGAVCKDDVSGGSNKNLFDGSSSSDPCGLALKRKPN